METFPWKRIVAVDDVEEALISSFTCGDEAMDGWFLNRALSWSIWVSVRCTSPWMTRGLLGSSPSLRPRLSQWLSGRMRKGKNSMEHPGLLLGRIAVREGLQGTGAHVGSLLLEHAVCRAVAISKAVGGRFIVLDAKNDGLCEWYSRHGFRSLRDNKLRMIMPMREAADRTERLGEGHFLF